MGLTLQFIPYTEIEPLSSEKRIQRVLSGVKENKIVLLEGQLRKREEAQLIEKTMESIDETFKGIELSVILQDTKKLQWPAMVKKKLLSLLLGNRIGLTIIGPASIVKEIKQNPDKIELLTKESRRRRRKE